MFKKRGLNRKAEFELKIYFWILQLLLIFLVSMFLMKFVSDVANNTMLEKNFLTRDIALLLDTIYAPPGDVTVDYENKVLAKSNFRLSFLDNYVWIYEEGQDRELDGYYYYYLSDPNIKFTPPDEIALKEGERLVFKKTKDTIEVSKK